MASLISLGSPNASVPPIVISKASKDSKESGDRPKSAPVAPKFAGVPKFAAKSEKVAKRKMSKGWTVFKFEGNGQFCSVFG